MRLGSGLNSPLFPFARPDLGRLGRISAKPSLYAIFFELKANAAPRLKIPKPYGLQVYRRPSTSAKAELPIWPAIRNFFQLKVNRPVYPAIRKKIAFFST